MTRNGRGRDLTPFRRGSLLGEGSKGKKCSPSKKGKKPFGKKKKKKKNLCSGKTKMELPSARIWERGTSFINKRRAKLLYYHYRIVATQKGGGPKIRCPTKGGESPRFTIKVLIPVRRPEGGACLRAKRKERGFRIFTGRLRTGRNLVREKKKREQFLWWPWEEKSNLSATALSRKGQLPSGHSARSRKELEKEKGKERHHILNWGRRKKKGGG